MLKFLYGLWYTYAHLLPPLMFTTPLRLISNGRVTIPAEIRRQLELEEGDPIMVTIESAGSD